MRDEKMRRADPSPNLSKSLNLRSSLNPPPSLQPQHPLLPSPRRIQSPPHPTPQPSTSTTKHQQLPYIKHSPIHPLPTPHPSSSIASTSTPPLTAFPNNTQAHKCYQRLLETIYLGTHITSLNQISISPPSSHLLLTTFSFQQFSYPL